MSIVRVAIIVNLNAMDPSHSGHVSKKSQVFPMMVIRLQMESPVLDYNFMSAWEQMLGHRTKNKQTKNTELDRSIFEQILDQLKSA